LSPVGLAIGIVCARDLSAHLVCVRCVTERCSIPAVGKLMELHGEGSGTTTTKAPGDDTGAKVERADGYEPPIQESV